MSVPSRFGVAVLAAAACSRTDLRVDHSDHVATLELALTGASVVPADGASTMGMVASARDAVGTPVESARVALACVGQPNTPSVSVGRNPVWSDAAGQVYFEITAAPLPGYRDCVARSGWAESAPVRIVFRGRPDVVPIYPGLGSWNDHVRRDRFDGDAADPELNWFAQDGTACDGTEAGAPDACLHSGELLRASVELASCDGIAADDAIGAFEWGCRMLDGRATVVSLGLRPGRGLAHLLAPTGDRFAPNQVRIWDTAGPALIAESPPAAWWGNRIGVLAANVGSGVDALSNSGTVFVVPVDTASDGINLDADRTALVVLPGATLSFSGASTPTCGATTGEIAGADTIALVCAGGQRFLWIEGALALESAEATDSQHAIHLVDVHRSHLRNLHVRDTPATAGSTGLFVTTSSANRVEHTEFVNNRGRSIYLHTTSNSLFLHSKHHTIDCHALRMVGDGVDNVVHGFLVAGYRETTCEGVLRIRETMVRNTWSHLTLANHGESGFLVGFEAATENQTVNQMLDLVGNRAMELHNGNHRISQLAASNEAYRGIELVNSSTNEFANNVMIHADNSAARCVVTGGVDPGLEDTSCNPSGLSTADVQVDVDLSGAVVGKVTADDPRSPDDVAGRTVGVVPYAWSAFSSWFRTWGLDGAYPSNANRAPCVAGADCRIWDWRLSAAGSPVLGRSGDLRSLNQPFRAGMPCPDPVGGDRTLTDFSGREFLFNAQEVLGDARGNDNGLCESGERCLYSPNIGVYQGHGDWRTNGECVFPDGRVTGVTLVAHPFNGALPVTHIEPNAATARGGQTIRVLGERFQDRAIVLIGGVPCLSTDFVSTSELQCVVPPSPTGPSAIATADVTVINADGARDGMSRAFTYLGDVPLWLDAGDPNTLVGSAAVSEWLNKGTAVIAVGQPDAAARPLVTPNGLAGRTTFRFSEPGTSRSLTCTDLAPLLAGAPAYTAFAVVRMRERAPTSETFQVFLGLNRHTSDGWDGPVDWSIAQWTDDREHFRVGHRDRDTNEIRNQGSTDIEVGRWYVYSASFDAHGGSDLRLGGVLDGHEPGTGRPLSSSTWGVGCRIGESVDVDDPFELHGDIAEILVFDRRLGESERVTVEEYLERRWRLQP